MSQTGGVAGRARHSPYPLISVEKAVDMVLAECVARPPVERNYAEARGHILDEDVIASEPHPPFAASIKDGYAVVAYEGAGNRRVVASSIAGPQKVCSSIDANVLASSYRIEPGEIVVGPGSCARVSTGAPIPQGADAVVQVEDTSVVEQEKGEEIAIDIKSTPNIGQDIRPVGSDIAVGDNLLPSGILINSPEIGILASIGKTKVRVIPKPRVAVLSTGNELEPPECPNLPFGKVRDSNRAQLVALFQDFGVETFNSGIAPDDESLLKQSLLKAFANGDVIVTSGGVSMGEKDLLKATLENEFGFSIGFGRIFMKPGKPTTFATGEVDGAKKLVFALPGNPVSAWVTAHLFVLPALRKLSGFANPRNTLLNVRVDSSFRLDERPEFRRATFHSAQDSPNSVCETTHGSSNALPLGVTTGANQMSSRLLSTRGANLLLCLPPRSSHQDSIQEGHVCSALVIGPL